MMAPANGGVDTEEKDCIIVCFITIKDDDEETNGILGSSGTCTGDSIHDPRRIRRKNGHGIDVPNV
jgi:hypothetical protein